jgi:hypothetical protein
VVLSFCNWRSTALTGELFHFFGAYNIVIPYVAETEELDGPAVSALGMRSRNLSNVLKGQS